MSVSIRSGRLEDTDAIMRFMDRHWRKGHILSRSRELLLHDFADGEGLNFALAWRDGDLVGLFGFMRYSRRPVPDLAGSLWKVVEGEKTPLLGLKLRQFVIDNVPHRFFAAPGAGPQTRPIYQVLGMNWARMTHWFMPNPQRDPAGYRLARIEPGMVAEIREETLLPCWSLQEVRDMEALERFPFARFDHILPFKDAHYIRHRFLAHPIYRYRVWHIEYGSSQALYVTRLARHAGAAALRVVDYYGDEGCLPVMGAVLRQQLRESGAEYADFIALGFDLSLMSQAGFTALDLDQERTIIPNYFEPFEQRNVPIYCVFDPVPEGSGFRMCRADGDQDRPAVLPAAEDRLMTK